VGDSRSTPALDGLQYTRLMEQSSSSDGRATSSLLRNGGTSVEMKDASPRPLKQLLFKNGFGGRPPPPRQRNGGLHHQSRSRTAGQQ
jgi:hypothetical protein